MKETRGLLKNEINNKRKKYGNNQLNLLKCSTHRKKRRYEILTA